MKKRPLKERKRIASQGGKASGQAKRENRTYKNIAKILMQTTPSDKTFDAFKTRYPKISEEDKNLKVLMVLGQISRAVQGDTQAFKTIMELAPDEEDMTDNKQGINIDDFYACCEICGYPPP
ncbi:MAG: hypothetical protein LBT79_01985 [Elusimicrobiota bacterium]|nr:hypothetical protein [Elusimicrobiota bacterium]